MAICRCHSTWEDKKIGHHCWTCDSDIIKADVTSDNMRKGTWHIVGSDEMFDDIYYLYDKVVRMQESKRLVMYDFEKQLHSLKNIEEKLRAFEKVCGAALIHDTENHLIVISNWIRRLEYYQKHPEKSKFYRYSSGKMSEYIPTEKEFNEYFNNLIRKSVAFLIKNVKL